MIDSKVIETALDANTQGFLEVPMREEQADGSFIQWEQARIQLEGTAVAISLAQYAVTFGLRRGDCRAFPDQPAEVLSAGYRVTVPLDVRSVGYLRITPSAVESAQTPVTFIIHISRQL